MLESLKSEVIVVLSGFVPIPLSVEVICYALPLSVEVVLFREELCTPDPKSSVEVPCVGSHVWTS